jgi:fructose-1,6-bisphosphatase
MNHLDAFLYKKVRTAAVVMTLVILTVVLGACQKSEPEAEKAAAPGSTVLDKVSEASGEATKATGDMAEETIEKTGEAAEAAGAMAQETKDEAVEAYQKGSAAVKEAASQGEDAVETAADAAGGALRGASLPKTE